MSAAFLVLALAAGCTSAARGRGSDDCWVNAYDRTGFRGAMTTYTGPSYESSSMKGASSLAVGPGSRIADLARLGFGRRVSAFKLVCD